MDSGSPLPEGLERSPSSLVHIPCLPAYLLRQKGYDLGTDGTQSLDNLCLKEEAGITRVGGSEPRAVPSSGEERS